MKTIDEIILDMSVLDKARQLTQINAMLFRPESKARITGLAENLGITQEDIKGTGSTLNFTSGGEAELIQEAYLKESKKQIPLIFMQDVVHGYRTVFPIPLAMGCTFDAELLEDCAEMSAKEARAHGVQATFSPMVDLVRDSRWGRVLETTGEDPYLNGEMGKAFIRGYHKGGLACCVKHFAAYGAAEAGRDYNTTEIGPHTLREYYLRAYEECMRENPEMVMTSFNLLNGIPVNGSKELLIDVLRNEWGFDGVVISDYNAIREMMRHGYLETEKECAMVAANNEIDMEMCSGTYIQYLPELVAEGKVSEETIDRMTRRVLQLKEKMGLLDNPYAGMDIEKAKELELCPEHRELARNAAEKSFVLLKNEGVLPLRKENKIALVGPYIEEQRILGAWRCDGKLEEAISVRQGIESYLQQRVDAATGCDGDVLANDCSKISEAVELAKKAEIIVACVGEPMNSSGESRSRSNLLLPVAQMELLRALKETGKPIVAILFGGRAQILTEMEPLVDAILSVWMPGTEGGNAIANVLYGKTVPSGKLTLSFPRNTGQCPIYYNHFSTGRPKKADNLVQSLYLSGYVDVLNAPLYAFGFGLSYTTFQLSDFKLSSDTLKKGEKLTASILVENTGKYDGEEVVQLYIQDYFASMVRPVQELKGYQKVFLKVGEQKLVEFEITEETLKFYDSQGRYTAEEGTFAIMLGNSSANVQRADFTYIK